MSFFVILIALIIEQVRPLPRKNIVHYTVNRWIAWVIGNLDAEKKSSAILSWLLITFFPVLLSSAIYFLFRFEVGWVAGFSWSVFIIYMTLGFRQFSHNFTQIRNAIYSDDDDSAREFLAKWKGVPLKSIPQEKLLQQLIEYSILNAQTYVFGVMTWYCIGVLFGLGAVGAIFYRVTDALVKYVSRDHDEPFLQISETFKQKIQNIWYVIDWIPTRITVLGFSFVGRFEDSIDYFRRQRALAPKDNEAMIIASACGAVNMQLDMAQQVSQDAAPVQREHLGAIVGLVWRIVVIWMVLLALLSIARFLG